LQPTPGKPSPLKASVCGPARLNAESLDNRDARRTLGHRLGAVARELTAGPVAGDEVGEFGEQHGARIGRLGDGVNVQNLRHYRLMDRRRFLLTSLAGALVALAARAGRESPALTRGGERRVPTMAGSVN
jgi:hypothetical protein